MCKLNCFRMRALNKSSCLHLSGCTFLQLKIRQRLTKPFWNKPMDFSCDDPADMLISKKLTSAVLAGQFYLFRSSAKTWSCVVLKDFCCQKMSFSEPSDEKCPLHDKRKWKKLKILWAALLINPRSQTNTNARNRCLILAHAWAKSGTHSHCLFSATSPQGAAQECGHFYLEWDKFQRGPDAQVRHYPWFISPCLSPRSGPGDCVKSSHHGNWAGMSQSFR